MSQQQTNHYIPIELWNHILSFLFKGYLTQQISKSYNFTIHAKKLDAEKEKKNISLISSYFYQLFTNYNTKLIINKTFKCPKLKKGDFEKWINIKKIKFKGIVN